MSFIVAGLALLLTLLAEVILDNAGTTGPARRYNLLP